MMKRFLFLLLCMQPLWGRCQLPDALLKDMCLHQYDAEFAASYAALHKPGAHINDARDVVELFAGYFPCAKVFMVINHEQLPGYHGGTSIAKLYLVDSYTGMPVRFHSREEVNGFFHFAAQEPVNLDKAYLCLYFLMDMEQDRLIPLPQYYVAINSHSIFATDGQRLAGANHVGRNACRRWEMEQQWRAAAENSTSDHIYMYADRLGQPFTLHYYFTFDEQNDLAAAVVDTIRYR